MSGLRQAFRLTFIEHFRFCPALLRTLSGQNRTKSSKLGDETKMIRRLLLTTAAAMVMMALSTVARADSFTITGINGTGVTASISNYTLVGNQFTFTITNTSVAPGSTGTITNIGFALPGERSNNFQLVSSTNSNYFVAHDLNATAGSQNFVSTFDLV